MSERSTAGISDSSTSRATSRARRSTTSETSGAPSAVHSQSVAVPPAPVSPPAPPVVVNAAPPPPRPPETFEVEVTVSPQSAALELDGEAAGTGHLQRRLPIDHHPHVLRASAPNYVAREIEFVDEPPPPQLELVAAPEAPRPAAKRPAPPRPPKHPAAPEPGEQPPQNTLSPNGAPVID